MEENQEVIQVKTRREFLISGAASVGAALGAYSSPVRSVLGSRDGLNGSNEVPTAKDYVQDSLIAMWDGIENVGWGLHDDDAASWVDLTGGGADWGLKGANNSSAFEIGPDYVKILSTLNGTSGMGYCTPSWASVDELVGMEIVFDAADVDMTTITNHRRVLGFNTSGTSNRSLWVQTGYISCGFGQYPCSVIPSGLNSMSLDFGVYRAMMNGAFFDSPKKGQGWITNAGPSLSGYAYGDAYCACGFVIKSLRLYGRSLSESERLSNYAVDCARFGTN